MKQPTHDPRMPEPLTSEERGLAERLARLGPHDGPSPVLDAVILAAAHAAAGSPPQARQPRWPTLLGIAATLALAIGVAWQLRPLPSAPAVQDETPREIAAVAARSGQSPADAATPPPAAEVTKAPAEPLPTSTSHDAARAASRSPASEPARQPEPTAAVPASASMAPSSPASNAGSRRPERDAAPRALAPAPAAKLQRAAPMAAPVQYSPTPVAFPAAPAPPPPALTATQAVESSANQEAATMSDRQYSAPDARKQRSAAAMAPQQDTPSDANEPAPADALVTIADLPVEQDLLLGPAAWLERIRQRRDAGDSAAARESLEAFRRVHPRLPLPSDLQALAESRPDR